MNPYKNGVEWLCAARVVQPTEDRVLLRAIMRHDGSDLAIAGTDTLQAVCHEVVSIGPDARGVEVGDHVIHISAAADAADFLNKDARYLFVRAKHIVCRWKPSDAMNAFELLPKLSNH